MYTHNTTLKKLDSTDRIPAVDLCSVALQVRQDVLECQIKLSISPKPADFSEDAIKLPVSLINFLTWLIGGMIHRDGI